MCVCQGSVSRCVKEVSVGVCWRSECRCVCRGSLSRCAKGVSVGVCWGSECRCVWGCGAAVQRGLGAAELRGC